MNVSQKFPVKYDNLRYVKTYVYCPETRNEAEGVTTLRELPAKFGLRSYCKFWPIIAVDSSISDAKTRSCWLKATIYFSIHLSLNAFRVLGLRSALLCTFPSMTARPRLYRSLIGLTYTSDIARQRLATPLYSCAQPRAALAH